MSPWIERSGGVLLHLTSLPSGRLDDDAYRMLELVASAGLRVWQILPMGPAANPPNPFEPQSAFAGDVALLPDRSAALHGADDFCAANAAWLPDWALFKALKAEHGGAAWWLWPAPLRHREPAALARARERLAAAIDAEVRAQLAFARAWGAFRAAAHARGVKIFGDVPLFVSRDSADVWCHRRLFEVDDEGRCAATVGVPPDDFAKEGQQWGFPPYRWDVMAAEGFAWWRQRFEVQAQRFDFVRIDHFRGLAAWWRIPDGARSAADGRWIQGPADASVESLRPVLRGAQLIAEDLGIITEDVTALRRRLGIPGMRVLQFAWNGDPHNPHLPRHHGADTVCYTGTHDNDTTLGWWRGAPAHERANFAAFAQQAEPAMPQALVECAWASPAPLAIVPMQDLLALGPEARMNLPGVAAGNWRWRFRWDQVPADFAPRVRHDLVRHGRAS